VSGYFGFGVIPGGTVRGSVLGGRGFFGPVFVPKVAKKTWANIVTGFEATGAFQQVIFANGLWVVGGSHTGGPTFALSSATGGSGSWASNNLPATANNRSVTGLAFGVGLYVMTGAQGGTAPRLFSSPDAVTWTLRANAFPVNSIIAVAFGNGVFVAIDTAGVSNHYETSPDGITWTAQVAFTPTSWSGQLFFDGTQFIAGAVVAGNNVVVSSPDGVNWTTHALVIAGAISGIGFDGAGYTIGNDTDDTGVHGATLATLNTAISFNDSGISTAQIATGGGSWARVDQNGTNPAAVSSANGINWTTDTTAVGGVSMGQVAFGQAKFIAVGSGPGVNQGGMMTRSA